MVTAQGRSLPISPCLWNIHEPPLLHISMPVQTLVWACVFSGGRLWAAMNRPHTFLSTHTVLFSNRRLPSLKAYSTKLVDIGGLHITNSNRAPPFPLCAWFCIYNLKDPHLWRDLVFSAIYLVLHLTIMSEFFFVFFNHVLPYTFSCSFFHQFPSFAVETLLAAFRWMEYLCTFISLTWRVVLVFRIWSVL